MKAEYLKHGQLFKRAGQRKFRTVNKIIFLGPDAKPERFKDHILIIFNGCNQLTVPMGTEVITKECFECDGLGRYIEFHQPAGICKGCQGTGVETIKD